jgi:hypothetical protein|tara:strand:+ start:269 stop:523 length:255 start_codon:yes stop_codon:yes gene_type:complete
LGRVTFNPLVHIDRMGTVIIPGLLMFFDRRSYSVVPTVSFSRLGSPWRGVILVAAASRGINLIIALVSAGRIHVSFLLPETAAY